MDTRLTALRKEKRVETAMQMKKEIEALSRMTTGQLQQKYLEVFGEESRSFNKQFLFRRIAWRIQALAEGGLSERARRPRVGDRERCRPAHPGALGQIWAGRHA